MFENICVIGFDADDTLWDNEIYFRKSEDKFCSLMKDFAAEKTCKEKLFAVETGNIPLYGYGVKSFILSMLESASDIAGDNLNKRIVDSVLEMARTQLLEPPILLDGIAESLPSISSKFKLILATKGDLLDQQRKLELSGLKQYFSHVEIMSEKNEKEYCELLDTLSIPPEKFMMIGNSVKSDILPVLEIGGYAIHIPYHTTWQHEIVTKEVKNERLTVLDNMRQVARLLLGSELGLAV